ncbi:hypothetical protein ACFE04_004697 [Oxalis oulophora]
MEGSSESPCRNSDTSKGLNSSGVSYRGPRFVGTDSVSASSGLRNDSENVDLAPDLRNPLCENESAADPFVRSIEWGDISLRQWLDKPDRSVDSFECLHIFRQIVDIVYIAHSQGIVVHNVRPSCFVMSSFNHISFIESASSSGSGSDSLDGGSEKQVGMKTEDLASLLPLDMQQQRNRMGNEDFQTANARSEALVVQPRLSYATCVPLVEESKDDGVLDLGNEQTEETKQSFPMKQILQMETSWYTSPEEVTGGQSSCDSDIYRLGILLFELFCSFGSREEKGRTMCSLRHRVLPPQLLLKWPKEASFCLWLLHPEPTNRPKMSELLHSEFLNDPRDSFDEREAAIKLRDKIEDQELVLEFLLLIQQRKQETAYKLQDTVSLLSADIEEVTKQQALLQSKEESPLAETRKDKQSASNLQSMNVVETDDSLSLGSRKRFRPRLQFQNAEECDDNLNEGEKSDMLTENQEGILSKSSRLMKNFKKLESAYFSTRSRPSRPLGRPLIRQSPISSDGRGSGVVNERSSGSENRQSEWINPFLEGLCKYLSFDKLKVIADLKQGDFLNSSNLVCSLSFDRDRELFATAGVNKKIKVFEYSTIMNDNRDIHYPIVEMASRSKLSSVCWNGYIKSQIASSNFEGVIQVWDIARSQPFMELKEHERCAWSVDYSLADPTLLASGSNDGSVKLWSINQAILISPLGVSIGTIRAKANVCCVQFPTDTSRSLAFGSADHKIYYYDLRNTKAPLCTFIGHNKTVSYVKFVDSMNLVSASTDNTIKLWDLSDCQSRVVDTPSQTFTGHTNVKNFVGLSVFEGYIATGSETNEVFIYHKALPMPMLSFKFDCVDPLTGHEMEDTSQFISSVCWRGQSSTLVAANSAGNIKILEMV